MKEKIEYIVGCNDTTKNFIDHINKVMNNYNGFVLDKYTLYQNGVYHTIFKIPISMKYILTFECFEDTGIGIYNDKKHYETVKITEYNKQMKPIKSQKVSFTNDFNIKDYINEY